MLEAPLRYVLGQMTRRGTSLGIGQAFPGSETTDQRSCPDRLSFVVRNFHVKKTITTTLIAHPNRGEVFGRVGTQHQGSEDVRLGGPNPRRHAHMARPLLRLSAPHVPYAHDLP